MNPSALKLYSSVCTAFSRAIMTTNSLWTNSLIGKTAEFGL